MKKDKIKYLFFLIVFVILILLTLCFLKKDNPINESQNNNLESNQELFPEEENVENNELKTEDLNINKKNENGETLLFLATKNGDLESVKELINAGADVDANNDEYGHGGGVTGKKALMEASRKGHLEIVKELIVAGADVNAKDSSGFTALMFASEGGKLETIKELINNGADVNQKAPWGSSPVIIASERLYSSLMLASAGGHLESVKELIRAGADVNFKDNPGPSALIVASSYNHLEVVKELIRAGANINAKDSKGYTSLMWASRLEYFKIVRELINAGALAKLSLEDESKLKNGLKVNIENCDLVNNKIQATLQEVGSGGFIEILVTDQTKFYDTCVYGDDSWKLSYDYYSFKDFCLRSCSHESVIPWPEIIKGKIINENTIEATDVFNIPM
jgi:ankyrin repeat protein